MLGGVSKTALFTLRARADEHARARRRFADPLAVEWLEALGWPAELDAYYSDWIQTKTAIRTVQIDRMVEKCRDATLVVELACGLSSRRQRLGFEGDWIDLDLPAVIAARESLGVGGERHRHVATSALEPAWIDLVLETAPASQTIVIAEGLFYYLPMKEVEALFAVMRERLAGAVLIFDVIGQMDFEAAKAFHEKIDAPIHWAVPPPFEEAMEAVGLDTIEGLEPAALVDEALTEIQTFVARTMFSGFARIKAFRDRRSGTMVGRLRAP